jgi:hypothetical protein
MPKTIFYLFNIDTTSMLFLHFQKHLKVDEFQEVFGMSYADFNNLPAWKQGQKKKDVGLF